MRTQIASLFIWLAVLVFAIGCATVEKHESTARLTVMYATMKVVEKKPDRADRILEIAGEVREKLSGETASSVSMLDGYVRDRIRWDRLDAADQLLVDTLLAELRTKLEERLGTDILPPDEVLVVDKVVSWIETAAQMAL